MTTAAANGLLICDTCELLNREAPGEVACARCGAALHRRKPHSYSRSWAFLVAACLLYIPANTLPILESGSLFGSQSDTILSGAVFLWREGSWVIALIIFLASIVVPGAKLLSLSFLLITAQRRSTWRPDERTRLYRATHYIGRWSMVDIFVGGLLVALVQLRPFASVEPGPGAIAFGAVVVLTMLASMSFDPRFTWDALDPDLNPEAKHE
jgi:paraquat-inducible protein A